MQVDNGGISGCKDQLLTKVHIFAIKALKSRNFNERKDMNPAARLLYFVNKAHSVPGNLPAIQGWRKVLDLKEDNCIEIYTGIADIIQLTRDTRKAIVGLDGYDQSLFLEPLDKVSSGINVVNLQGSWELVKNQFDDRTVLGLRFCSTVLDQHSKEATLSDDQIKSWLQDIEDLLDSIAASDVPDQLKIIFLEHLEKLRLALLHYWIFGTVGVQASVEKTFGALMIRRPEILAIGNDSFFKRFLALFTSVADAITVSEGVQALSGTIKSLLSSAP